MIVLADVENRFFTEQFLAVLIYIFNISCLVSTKFETNIYLRHFQIEKSETIYNWFGTVIDEYFFHKVLWQRNVR